MQRSIRIATVSIFCLAMFIGLSARSASAQGILREILDRMDTNNKALKSLRAAVKMSKFNSQLSEYDTYEGTVQYLPSANKDKIRVRIDWTKPASEALAVGGGKYILYRPSLQQAIVGSVDSAAGTAGAGGPLAFMSMSRAQLNANYSVEYRGEESVAGAVRTWHLLLNPKTEAKFKSADIWIDSNGMPVQARITEKNNDTTTIVLSSIEKNVTLNASSFTIKPPKNTKIIQG